MKKNVKFEAEMQHMQNQNFDIIQISYDEPNADKNYFLLKEYYPDCLRVKNIKGFDNAHRSAARLSKKDWVFIIDGDCEIKSDFFFDIKFFQKNIEPHLRSNSVLSWASKNVVNGLIYGNGGIKLWPRRVLETVDSHENGKLDWIGDVEYVQMNNWYGYSVINETPFQAWRAGLREGTKFCFVNNKKIKSPIKEIQDQNFLRLMMWLSVGCDVANGIYAIIGARMGVWLTLVNDWDPNVIKDYDQLAHLWNNEYSFLKDHYQEYNDDLMFNLRKYFDLPVCNLNPEQSRWAKFIYQNPKRQGVLSVFKNEVLT